MNKTSNIYIAGHRGLVGTAILKKLEAEGYTNLILHTSKELDLRNQADVDRYFYSEKPEYIFLAAAKVGGIYANNAYPADFIRNNLQIQTNVIDAAYRSGVKKLIFFGSSCIYPKNCTQPMKEECILTGELEKTNEWYAIAKIAGIKMCQAYRRQFNFNAISVMPTNLYGPCDNFDLQTSHVLPAMIRKFHLVKLAQSGDVNAIMVDEKCHGPIPDEIVQNLGLVRDIDGVLRLTHHASPKIVLWGTGMPKREFMHVEDLADACLFLMRSYDGEEMLNIGVGQDNAIRDLAEMIRNIVGLEGSVSWDNTKPDGTPRKLLDVSRMRRLGWEASIELRKGIEAVYDWYRRDNGVVIMPSKD